MHHHWTNNLLIKRKSDSLRHGIHQGKIDIKSVWEDPYPSTWPLASCWEKNHRIIKSFPNRLHSVKRNVGLKQRMSDGLWKLTNYLTYHFVSRPMAPVMSHDIVEKLWKLFMDNKSVRKGARPLSLHVVTIWGNISTLKDMGNVRTSGGMTDLNIHTLMKSFLIRRHCILQVRRSLRNKRMVAILAHFLIFRWWVPSNICFQNILIWRSSNHLICLDTVFN